MSKMLNAREAGIRCGLSQHFVRTRMPDFAPGKEIESGGRVFRTWSEEDVEANRDALRALYKEVMDLRTDAVQEGQRKHLAERKASKAAAPPQKELALGTGEREAVIGRLDAMDSRLNRMEGVLAQLYALWSK